MGPLFADAAAFARELPACLVYLHRDAFVYRCGLFPHLHNIGVDCFVERAQRGSDIPAFREAVLDFVHLVTHVLELAPELADSGVLGVYGLWTGGACHGRVVTGTTHRRRGSTPCVCRGG